MDKRLKTVGNLWEDFWKKRQSLSATAGITGSTSVRTKEIKYSNGEPARPQAKTRLRTIFRARRKLMPRLGVSPEGEALSPSGP